MRKLNKSNKTIDEAFELVKKGCHNPKKEFLKDNEKILKDAYKDYDQKASEGKLHELRSLWSNGDGKDYIIEIKGSSINEFHAYCEVANSTYNSSLKFVDTLWEELETINSLTGIREEIICPICGLRKCGQLDHHAPRAVTMFPEYSSHFSNLVPLCDDCNETKKDYWTDNEDGVTKRIWFNPYFDSLPDFDIFVPKIEILLGLPKAKVSLNNLLDRSNNVHDVICRTIEHLNLLKKYDSALEIELNSFEEREILAYQNEKSRYKDAQDYCNSMFERIDDLLKKGKRQTMMEIFLYKAILTSPDYKDWMIEELQKH